MEAIQPENVICEEIQLPENKDNKLHNIRPFLIVNPSQKRKVDTNDIKIALIPCDCYQYGFDAASDKTKLTNANPPEECPIHFVDTKGTRKLMDLPKLIFPLLKGELKDIAELLGTTTHFARRSAAVTVTRICYDKKIDTKLANAQFGWARYSLMIKQYGGDWIDHLEATTVLIDGYQVILDAHRIMLAIESEAKRAKTSLNKETPEEKAAKLAADLEEVNKLKEKYDTCHNKGFYDISKDNPANGTTTVTLPNSIQELDDINNQIKDHGYQITKEREEYHTPVLDTKEKGVELLDLSRLIIPDNNNILNKINSFGIQNPELPLNIGNAATGIFATSGGLPLSLWDKAITELAHIRELTKRDNGGKWLTLMLDLRSLIYVKEANGTKITLLSQERKAVNNHTLAAKLNLLSSFDNIKNRVRQWCNQVDTFSDMDKWMFDNHHPDNHKHEDMVDLAIWLMEAGWVAMEDLSENDNKFKLQILDKFNTDNKDPQLQPLPKSSLQEQLCKKLKDINNQVIP